MKEEEESEAVPDRVHAHGGRCRGGLVPPTGAADCEPGESLAWEPQ
eukprot:gene5405-5630_t